MYQEYCKYCKYWLESLHSESFDGHCHRFPPPTVRWDFPDPIADGFPKTNKYDWCGEFVSKTS